MVVGCISMNGSTGSTTKAAKERYRNMVSSFCGWHTQLPVEGSCSNERTLLNFVAYNAGPLVLSLSHKPKPHHRNKAAPSTPSINH
jgi:hypothetical protein